MMRMENVFLGQRLASTAVSKYFLNNLANSTPVYSKRMGGQTV